ncbi:MAG TPA: hypothetical protein VGV60_06695 [Candidatus Polarisedimenticolia bacterium]|jgi:hypothetical protein|nr:hypothetical protein [Candidatus Polarisedimenticolia bacterium]
MLLGTTVSFEKKVSAYPSVVNREISVRSDAVDSLLTVRVPDSDGVPKRLLVCPAEMLEV